MAREAARPAKRPRGSPGLWEHPTRWLLLLGAILAAGWGIRATYLAADPPDRLSWSQGPFTDGAVVLHDARNKILYGEWIVDYTKDLYLFPLSNILTYPVYLAAGVGRWQAAFPNTVLGALSLLLMGLGLARAFGRKLGVLWVLLGAFSYFLIMFQRIPLAEPAMIFLLVVSFYFFATAKGARGLAAAGFFAMAAPLFGKAHAYYFPVVLLLALRLAGGGGKEGERPSLRPPLLGMGAALLLWLGLLFLPHAGHIWSHVAHESYRKHVGGTFGFAKEILQNAISMGTYTRLFQNAPFVCSLGFLSIAGILARGRRAIRDTEPVLLLLSLWAVIGWFALALVRMPAPRYLTALYFPLLGLAVVAIGTLREGKPLSWRPPRTAGGRLLFALLLFFAVYQPLSSIGTPMLAKLKNSSWGLGIYTLFVQEEQFSELILFCSVLSILVVLFVFGWLLARGGDKPIRLPLGARSGAGLVLLLVAASLLVDAVHWYAWASRRTYYLQDASRDLDDWLGPNARLIGSYAPTLGLDNKLKVFAYFGEIGETDVFRKHEITHAVVVSQGDHAEVKGNYPEIFEKWQMVLSYPIRSRYSDTIAIFRIPSEVNGERIHDYEPGLFERAVDVAKERRWQEALDLLLRFLGESPENADGHYLVGFMYNELGHREEAIRSIQRAIELRDQRPYYYFKLGEIYADLGRTGEARRALEIASRLNPRDRDVKEALGSMGRGAH
ncbi:MAG: tetratricopeptide repeat protein [Candidatus Latescibacterota bacterium]|nr:MAG: tetratricopeptide repeat protein [Candidatus Latescibacterota bacterium]